jgi:signal transduction histidine kinase
MKSRWVLAAGFGGLLLLLTFAGADMLDTLGGIQASNDSIREDFLRRTHVLERIRTDLYASGTYVRDYLLEPESGRAEGHRDSLVETKQDMDMALGEYQRLLTVQEAEIFQRLTKELASYWNVLQPVFHWSAEKRMRDGFPFLRDEVFPRRQAMLGIADQIRDIDESQLNAVKLLGQRTDSQFRRRLTITLGLTVGVGLLLAVFCIRKILQLERETARHFREIENARVELQQLSARLLAAQEEERRSISRELHDEIGQALTGVLVEMANLSTLIRAHDLDGVDAKAREIKHEIEGSISVARNMALLLRPSMLDDLGLLPALEWQAREVGKRNGLWIKVDAADVSEELPEEHKTCIYRIVQEALHNIVQHAGAHSVNLTVRQQEGSLSVTVRDDGKGFDPHRQRGMGLLGIEERVGHLGGTLTVESQPGHGTTLHVKLPLMKVAA